MGQKKSWQSIKSKYLDIIILLSVLLVVSFGITKIYAKKNNQNNPRRIIEPVGVPHDFMRDLQPLIISRSVEKIAQYLKLLPVNHVLIILKKIITDENSLLEWIDKLQLIFAVAGQYEDDTMNQQAILDLMEEYKNGEPFLLIAARTNYAHALPMLVAWAQAKQDSYIQDALDQAVEENDVQALENLLNATTLTENQLNELLWNIVDNNKSDQFIPLLVQHGADINYKHPSKRTPLIRATENNNLANVTALLDSGADYDLIIDDAIGSPLQMALEKGYVAIDILLRERGARE